jgi:hypothetical protein
MKTSVRAQPPSVCSMSLIQSASPVDLGKLAVTARGRDSRTGPTLVEQEHGGALLDGGVRGHRGVGGRPPSAIREAARLAFAERLHVLTDIADDEDAKAMDRIRALDLLGKYGGVDKLPVIVEQQPVAGPLTTQKIEEMWVRLNRIRTVEELEKMLVATAEEQAAAKGVE